MKEIVVGLIFENAGPASQMGKYAKYIFEVHTHARTDARTHTRTHAHTHAELDPDWAARLCWPR